MNAFPPEVVRVDVDDAELGVVRWRADPGAPVVFAVHSFTARQPFISPRLFLNRNYSLGLFLAFMFGMLNFAPMVLSVPSTISVRKVDLAVELQILTYHEQRKANAAPRNADGAQLHQLSGDRQRGATA